VLISLGEISGADTQPTVLLQVTYLVVAMTNLVLSSLSGIDSYSSSSETHQG